MHADTLHGHVDALRMAQPYHDAPMFMNACMAAMIGLSRTGLQFKPWVCFNDCAPPTTIHPPFVRCRYIQPSFPYHPICTVREPPTAERFVYCNRRTCSSKCLRRIYLLHSAAWLAGMFLAAVAPPRAGRRACASNRACLLTLHAAARREP